MLQAEWNVHSCVHHVRLLLTMLWQSICVIIITSTHT
jgi:hypothetical protein